MDSMQALNSFWNGFGWKAYDENTVPDDAMERNGGKYITYEAAFASFDEPIALTASLWQRSTAWNEIVEKSYEISRAIGLGGKVVDYDDGKMWVVRGTPFAQRAGDEDDTIRRIYINITAEFMTAERG